MFAITNVQPNMYNKQNVTSFKARKLPSAYTMKNFKETIKEIPQMSLFDKIRLGFKYFIANIDNLVGPNIYIMEKGEKEIFQKRSMGLMDKLACWMIKKPSK